MSDLSSLLNSSIGKSLINVVTSKMGANPEQAQSALGATMPMILSALAKNASSADGAKGIFDAIMKKHDGSILDNLDEAVTQDEVVEDGGGILGHIFGDKTEKVAGAVSQSSGMDLSSAMNIMKMAAPVIMGYLGRQTRQNNVSNPMDISNILSGMLGGQQAATRHQSFIEKLIDQDGDGSIMDDIAGMGMKYLGGMFKK